MRIIFFCIVLINIIFFIWEYRKGAPEIYLPANYENNSGSDKYQHKIFLLTESHELQSARNASEIRTQQTIAASNEVGKEALLKDTKPYDIVNYSTRQQSSNVKSDVINNSAEQLENNFIAEKNLKQIIACYQLIKDEDRQNSLAQKLGHHAYKLDLFEQQVDENSYLVLTLAANSSQEAVNNEQLLKQLGINDLWLFREGLFQWRISLGLFSGMEHAEKAKEQFSERTNQELEVVPSYLTKTVTIAKISTVDRQEVTAFEKKFAMIVDQKIECNQVKEAVVTN